MFTNELQKRLRIHYPTAHRALQVYMDDFRKYSGTVQVIHNICNCIEQAYGRLPPTVVESHQFLKNRSKYIKELSQAQHFSERDGGTFEDLVDGEYIMLLSEKEPPVNESQNQSNPASESLIHMKFSSPPKTVQQQRTVNIKDTIKISIKSTAMSFDKAQEEKDLRENLNALKARNLSRDARNYVKGLYSGGRSALSADRNNLESVSPPPPSDSHNSDGRGFDKRPVRRFNPRESFRPGNSRERNYRERNYRERSGSREDKRERGRSRSPVRRSPRRSRSPRSHQHPRDNYNSSYRPPVEEPLRLLPDVDHGKLLHKLDLLQRKIEDGERISRKTMEYHEKNPEKHPLYQEEWKKYWNKRYKELKAANADVTQYDFKPEWIVFWGKRMKELHLAKLEDLKMEHCRRLNLSTEEPEYSSYFKFMDQTTTIGSPRENINRERNASPPPIERRCEMPSKEKPDFQQSFSREGREEMYDGNSRDGRDGKDGRDDRIGRAARYSWDARDKKRNYQPNRPGEKESRPPRTKERRFGSPPKNSKAGDNGSDISPWDDDNGSVDSVIIVSNSRKGESVSRDSKSASIRGRDVISTEREWSFGQSSKPAKKEFSELKTDKMDINVISVLRLLTALENYLGSLGPKIVDLLAVALKMEKDKPNSSDDILLDDTYNVLFETVKEKLKGQLLAGLVEGNAVQATKTAIQYTASLLHKGTQLATTRKMIEEQEKIKSKHMPVKVEGIGKVEKAAIAKQIAAALIAQGKTSVTTEELEALVNAVVGMANAAQTTQKPAEPIGLLTKLTNPSIEKVPLLSTLKVKDFSKEAESSSTNALQMLQSAYTQKGGQAQVSPVKVPPDEPTGMEGLSDSDLKTLLQNFKDLSSDEQHGLIAYLKKLEFKEPKRVEKLRKFVNLDPEQDNPDERETSPFSSRECGNNPEGKTLVSNKAAPAPVEKVELKHKDSDDEDDYTFDEVFKSASEKVKEKQMQDELEVINKTLKETSDAKTAALDTQSIISNLMVSLKQGQGSNAAPDLVEGSVAGGCNAENIAKVLSLIGSMAGQDAPVLTPATAPAPLLPLPTQPPPPPPPLSEAVQISNQNIPANETFNQNMLNETSNFNMQAQSAMNQDHYDRNNFPESSQYPQSMRNHNPDTGFPNMLPRGNLNDFPNDFGGQPQYNEMGYAQNQAFGNGNFRPFPAGMNRGNQYPDDMRAAYGHNAVVGGNYQDMYDGDRPWNNDQHRMLPQNQYGDRLPMEEDYYNSDYDNLPLNNFRGHNRNMNRGKTGGRGKMRGRGNMDWRGGFMRN